ncbi:MAG: DSD1 family PLP-dependent enzyme, partial [Nitrospinota bacterium]
MAPSIPIADLELPLPARALSKEDIETPALLVDIATMERNLARMAEFFRGTRVRLRPHTKTHKCPLLAHKQLALGATGVCCQK